MMMMMRCSVSSVLHPVLWEDRCRGSDCTVRTFVIVSGADRASKGVRTPVCV